MDRAGLGRTAPLFAIVAVSALVLLVRATGIDSPLGLLSLSLLPGSMLLASYRDFESLAGQFSKEGMRASSPAPVVGKSGVKHEFAFAVGGEDRRPTVVADVELSVNEVDEMKVLSFYVKVFDVSPEHAILCVSPKLGERAKELAKEYKLEVIEDETPRKLIPKAADAVRSLVEGR